MFARGCRSGRPFNPDARARAGKCDDLQVPSDLGGPFAHADQADPAAVPSLLQIKTLPLVLYLDPDWLGQVQADMRLRCLGVLDDIVQRFLGNAKQSLFFQRFQRLFTLDLQRNRKILWQVTLCQVATESSRSTGDSTATTATSPGDGVTTSRR